MTAEMMIAARYIDGEHNKGRMAVRRKLVAFLIDTYQVRIHNVTAGRIMKKLGLRWSTIIPSARSYASYRSKAISDYLISLDRYVKDIDGGDSDFVCIFTDESYVNVNHAEKHAFFPIGKEEKRNLTRKSGKGKRLIILHAIRDDGPLVEYDEETGYPTYDLEWRKDTPHQKT